MFDNHTDLNNTVTCFFMHLIGLKVKVAANEPLKFFFYRTDPLDEDKKDRCLGTPRNRYLLTAKRCGRCLKQRGIAMDRNV